MSGWSEVDPKDFYIPGDVKDEVSPKSDDSSPKKNWSDLKIVRIYLNYHNIE